MKLQIFFCHSLVLSAFLDFAHGLSCFVGLGNSSKRDEQKVVECPKDKYYVCVKMYGGGMGDQIRRKCEKLNIPDYELLIEREDERARLREEDKDMPTDPTCFETTHHGRPVHVCHCSTDQCNGAHPLHRHQNIIWIIGIITAYYVI